MLFSCARAHLDGRIPVSIPRFRGGIVQVVVQLRRVHQRTNPILEGLEEEAAL